MIALLEDLVAQASNEEEEEEDADTREGKSVAALANEPASTPGKHGTPCIAKKNAKRTEPPFGKKPATKIETTATSGSQNEVEGRASELPHPEEDRGVQAIKRHRVCFYHSRGNVCPHQQAGCQFSHDDTVIPFAYYPRNEVAALHEMTRAEMEQAYGGNRASPAATSVQDA